MSNDAPEDSDRSLDDDLAKSRELRDVVSQIERTVDEASRIREQLNKVRKQINRELHRLTPATNERQSERISAGLRQLHQEEAALGEKLREFESKLNELWSRRRDLEGKPLAATIPSELEAEENRLRWLLMDVKNKQLEAAEQSQTASDPAERSRYEQRFNDLREEYNAVYNQLNAVREARQKE